jgi:AAA+ ATPase superfamily predicted ATPase
VFDSFDEWSEEYLHVEKEVIIAVDEAQILRNLKRVKSRTEFRSLLAHCHDNL